jgi:stringent starvation protein B
MNMTSNRPYLLRALNEWILDNHLTPYLLVNAEADGVEVPGGYADNGKVVLNISPAAVKGITISNEAVNFNARFGGVSCFINIPVLAILAIYAKENGMGMIFPDETPDRNKESVAHQAGVKSHLKVIK